MDVVENRTWPRLSSDRETILFRIAQEALLNVAKHAQASMVRIEADVRRTTAVLMIADNGIGFDTAAVAGERKKAGWGVMTMRERAEGAGAIFHIDSRSGKGTRVMVSVPRRWFVV